MSELSRKIRAVQPPAVLGYGLVDCLEDLSPPALGAKSRGRQ